MYYAIFYRDYSDYGSVVKLPKWNDEIKNLMNDILRRSEFEEVECVFNGSVEYKRESSNQYDYYESFNAMFSFYRENWSEVIDVALKRLNELLSGCKEEKQ